MYVRVILVNAAVLLTALLLLVLTPVTVSAPISAREVILLVVTLVAMVAADAVLLKVSFSGLAELVRRMETLDVLRPHERLPEMGGVETRALISGFNTMIDRLQAERRASMRRGVAIVEGERQRISRELHDEIGQRMTGILLQLARIHDDAPAVTRLHIARVQDEARAVMDEIGALAWQVRPRILDDLGLLSALKALTASLASHGYSGIDTVLPRELPKASSEVELAIYRVAQEALTNAIRHSGATNIAIAMKVTHADLVVRVTDDGCGLPGPDREGPGLRGMRERALLIGGRLDVQESPPHGVRVELAVPLGLLGS